MQATFWKSTLLGSLMVLMAGCSAPAAASDLANRVHAFTNPPTANQATSSPAAASSDVQAALQAVVKKANDEQQQAFGRHDPSAMKDTSTDDYYQQMVDVNSGLAGDGVTAIQLLKLDWGDISVNGSQAQVTTTETWRTTYDDGTTDEDTDRNVYTLVNQNGAWKVSDDAHPDSELQQPAPSGSGGASGSSGRSGSSASTGSSGTTGSAPGNQPAPRSVPAGRSQSRNWSGYEATGGNYTAVNATWTVPQVSASSTGGADATWVGIGGVRSRDLIQAGTEATATASGRVRYNAWVEKLPQVSHPVPLTVAPGDSISVSIKEQAAGEWLIDFKNNSTGQTYQTTEQYSSSHSSAEWVEEAPSGGRRVLPLDNFGTVSFSHANAVKDGQTVSLSQAGGQAITMIDGAGRPIASPSALGSDGGSFSVTRNVASSTTAPDGGFGITPSGRGRGRAGFGGIPGLGF